jgi:hypothetical protein
MVLNKASMAASVAGEVMDFGLDAVGQAPGVALPSMGI